MSETYNVGFLILTESASLDEISLSLKMQPHKDSVEMGDRFPFSGLARVGAQFERTVWRIESGISGASSPAAHFRALAKKLDSGFRKRLAALAFPHDLLVSVGVFTSREMKLLHIDQKSIELFAKIPCGVQIDFYRVVPPV